MKKTVFSLIAALTLQACASAPQLSYDELNARVPTIQQLATQLESQGDRLSLLSPEEYLQASNLLEESRKLGLRGSDQAVGLSQQGIKAVAQASKNSERAEKLLEDVLVARQSAIKVNAPSLLKDEFLATEEQLKKATALLAEGNVESVKQQRAVLEKSYSDLEVSALKKNVLQVAKEKMQQARADSVQRYAPKTLEKAQEQLTLAENIINADKSDLQKSNEHAKQALYLTQQSIEIAEQLKDFKRRDFTHEDVILWYQDQLASVVAGTDVALEFDRDNKTVVRTTNQTLISQIDRQVAADETLRDQLMQTEEAKKALEQRQRLEQEKLNFVQNMFNSDEAEVFSKGKDVLVRAHGFYFSPGKSNIESRNFVLLQKIKDVLSQYPDATIEITGHTDSTGNSAANQTLSQKRADEVKKFLIEIGRIENVRLTSDGWGADKPVAANDSAEGRAQNRRVEFLIKPNSTM